MNKVTCCSRVQCILYGFIGALIGSLLFTIIPKVLGVYHNRVTLSVKVGDIVDTCMVGTGLHERRIIIIMQDHEFHATDAGSTEGFEHFYTGNVNCSIIEASPATSYTTSNEDPIMHHDLTMREVPFMVSTDAKVIGHVDLYSLYERADQEEINK